jgi:hypothetical protein
MTKWPDRKSKICPICGGKMYKDAKVCKKCRVQSGSNNSNWRGGISTNNYHYRLIQKQRYPEKCKARQLVKNAIKSGKILRGKCVICNSENAEAHHEDYTKPLEIIWVCKTHHKEFHDGKITLPREVMTLR